MRGSEGDDVKILQNRLKDLGYSLGEPDSFFGKKTELAVIEFKKIILVSQQIMQQ